MVAIQFKCTYNHYRKLNVWHIWPHLSRGKGVPNSDSTKKSEDQQSKDERRKKSSRVSTQDDNDAMGRLAVTIQPFIPRPLVIETGGNSQIRTMATEIASLKLLSPKAHCVVLLLARAPIFWLLNSQQLRTLGGSRREQCLWIPRTSVQQGVRRQVPADETSRSITMVICHCRQPEQAWHGGYCKVRPSWQLKRD